MPTPPTLTTQLSTLSDSNKALQTLIHRLSKLAFSGTGDEHSVRLELTGEIQETLKGLESELELLREEVEPLQAQAVGNKRGATRRESERSRVVVAVKKLGEDLRLSHVQFQQAQRVAKRNAEAAKRNAEVAKLKEREQLFAGGSGGASTPARRKGKDLSADEVLVNAASDVTSALRRSHQLMQSELSRSRFAQETLEQSTAALADLGENYSNLSTLLSSSRSLLTTLVQSQKSDTWYLETAFYILLTTIIWLVFRRFLYGPLWWFVYLPLKLFYKFSVAALTAVGITGGAASTSLAVSQSTSLIVKPSAQGRAPSRMSGHEMPSMRVGGGGQGAKQDVDPSAAGSMSRSVGQMAENTPSGEAQGEGSKEPEKEQAKRGDGKPLVDSDKPRNPKKRMFDTEVEDAKREEAARVKDEL